MEERRLAEQVRLDGLKSPAERNRLGQFATPPALALEIVEYARQLRGRKRGPVRFLDPAIGTGAFFSAFSRVFKTFDAAAGVEIDPGFAEVVRRLWSPAGLSVISGDFTKLPVPNERFNLVLTNPPYVRHHHLDSGDKQRLGAAVADALRIDISGLAGLYCYFLLLADAWLEPDGIAIWLIPSEFMDVNYGTAIKKYLTEQVRLLRIHRFDPADMQFQDALVSSAIVIFHKAQPGKDHAVEMTLGGSLAKPTRAAKLPLETLRESRKWTQYPGNGKLISRATVVLSDLFTIKRGLATGDNKFFILPREQAAKLKIPAGFLRPILPSPRFLKQTVIESDPDGYPRLENQLVLIDCPLQEDVLQEKHPAFFAYLQHGKENEIDKGYLASRRKPWYSQERRDPAPFVCTYMGRTNGDRKPFRFILNHSQAIAANVYLLLYPKGSLKCACEADPELRQKVFDILRTIESEAFIAEGRVYGGGLHKMEPAELGRLSAAPISSLLPPMPSQ
jgi:adenine-specific DNA-methyltransferase